MPLQIFHFNVSDCLATENEYLCENYIAIKNYNASFINIFISSSLTYDYNFTKCFQAIKNERVYLNSRNAN